MKIRSRSIWLDGELPGGALTLCNILFICSRGWKLELCGNFIYYDPLHNWFVVSRQLNYNYLFSWSPNGGVLRRSRRIIQFLCLLPRLLSLEPGSRSGSTLMEFIGNPITFIAPIYLHSPTDLCRLDSFVYTIKCTSLSDNYSTHVFINHKSHRC